MGVGVFVAEELGGGETRGLAFGGGDDDFFFLRGTTAVALFFHLYLKAGDIDC